MESNRVGLQGRIEYYFNHSKDVLYQRFQKPFEQTRSYWEADGSLFVRNWEDGLDIKVAYGRYYSKGFSTRFWVQLNNEYRRVMDNSTGKRARLVRFLVRSEAPNAKLGLE